MGHSIGKNIAPSVIKPAVQVKGQMPSRCRAGNRLITKISETEAEMIAGEPFIVHVILAPLFSRIGNISHNTACR
jgi:hypothetical protein